MTQQLLTVFIVSMLLVGCTRRQEEEHSSENADVRVPVTIAAVSTGDASATIRAVGKTDALRKQKVFSPIAGIVTALHIQEGSFVRSGETVAIIRTKEAQAAIAGAEALLQSATSEHQKQEAQHALELSKRSDNVAVLKAPFDGYVAQRLVSESEVVAENAELATLIDLSTVVVVAQVPMQDVGSVKVGQRALVEFPSINGRTFEARVDAISPQAMIESQTVPVRLRFTEEKARLNTSIRTEMIASVGIVTGKRLNALFVPKKALLRNDETGQYSVFTMTGDSIAIKIDVEVGVQSDSTVEIRTNRLRSGMPVIVEGSYGLADSTRVEVR
jgi:multidrug efflux pump subunit AcrA (membrane-fusion protein)